VNAATCLEGLTSVLPYLTPYNTYNRQALTYGSQVLDSRVLVLETLTFLLNPTKPRLRDSSMPKYSSMLEPRVATILTAFKSDIVSLLHACYLISFQCYLLLAVPNHPSLYSIIATLPSRMAVYLLHSPSIPLFDSFRDYTRTVYQFLIFSKTPRGDALRGRPYLPLIRLEHLSDGLPYS